MTPQELTVVRDTLVASKVIDANASEADILAAHQQVLAGPSAAQYKQTLQASGIATGPNWLMLLGLGAGAVALYFVWKHYQDEETHVIERPEPLGQHQVRGITRALGALRMGGSSAGCRPSRMGRFGSSERYEFEPERRLEGYRRRGPARRK